MKVIYIDTDVLVHAYVVQDAQKNRQANEIIEQVNQNDGAVISTLSIQEMLFVLEKLGIDNKEIETVYEELMQLNPVAYDIDILQRAFDIAKSVGFRNINDCVHTSIAESFCTDLITYNKRDFRKIKEFARILVTIL